MNEYSGGWRVCYCVHVCTWDLDLSFHHWGQRIELRSSGMAADAFTHWAISPALQKGFSLTSQDSGRLDIRAPPSHTSDAMLVLSMTYFCKLFSPHTFRFLEQGQKFLDALHLHHLIFFLFSFFPRICSVFGIVMNNLAFELDRIWNQLLGSPVSALLEQIKGSGKTHLNSGQQAPPGGNSYGRMWKKETWLVACLLLPSLARSPTLPPRYFYT